MGYHSAMPDRTELTNILERLAAGEIDTAQAAALIDALPPEETPTDTEPPDILDGEVVEGGEVVQRPRPEADEAGRARSPLAGLLRDTLRRAAGGGPKVSAPQVERLMVRGVGRRVRIIGDPAVATVSVDGPHVLRRNGAVIEVTSDGDIGPSLDGFSIIRPPRSLEDFRNLSLGKQLVVRVNPAIVVDAEVTGGSLRLRGVPVVGKLRLSAGSMRCTDVTQIDDALVQMGSATVAGTFTQGRSRVRVESGALTVRLASASSVTVRAESQLGGVSWPGEQAYEEYVVGQGAARLDLAVVMGHAAIRLELTPEEEAVAEAARAEAKRVADEAKAEANRAKAEARAARQAARAAAKAAREQAEAAAHEQAEAAAREQAEAARAAGVSAHEAAAAARERADAAVRDAGSGAAASEPTAPADEDNLEDTGAPA